MNEPSRLEKQLQDIGRANYERDDYLPVIQRFSPEWKAWLAFRAAHRMRTAWWVKQERVTVPTLWPPTGLRDLEKDNFPSTPAPKQFVEPNEADKKYIIEGLIKLRRQMQANAKLDNLRD